ncbi:GerAB/ArcD/ProY family transporter [Virgibacillus oceani]|uniref:Germination protein GerB n=1 Tax=Virgibacillus oceani TaxID=1479511 RepID=A0A917HRP5_9BACI|nr:GerAB/ArcD/ProY family transporter [Virgibacillus oceani]GGG87055.1 germination protein GerB [Virgibacillus oceani]
MIKDKDQVPPLMAFFLITGAQIGVGVLSFTSVINKYAGHDAWISIIVAGIIIHILIWLMYKVLNKYNGKDFAAIHREIYGKWIGAFISIIISFYLMFLAAVVLRSYMEIIQVWMFPDVKLWALLLLIMPLIYYIISGKFRIVVGVCFLGVVYPFTLMFALIYPLKYSKITNILPVFDHSLMEIVQSSALAMFSFLGIGALMIYCPFIKESSKSQKYAHFGNLYTTSIYVVVCFVSYIYYSQHEIKDIIWPTLGLWKIVELPFLDRFEYIGISTLFFVILPNLALYTWGSSRTLYRVLHIKQKWISITLLTVIYFICIVIEGREKILLASDFITKIGVGLLFYIPILFVMHFISRKVKRNAS